METKIVRLDLNGSVAVITLSRAESANRLDRVAARQLEDACRTVAREKAIRVVVVTGSGTDFCAGIESTGENADFGETLACANAAVEAVAAVEQPVIAAVNGTASGVGLALALACDLRIASITAVMSVDDSQSPGVLVGGISQRLPRIAGKGKGLEMLLTGESVAADEARRWGLVSQVTPAAEVAAVALRLAEKIATRAPIAERYTKEAVLKGLDLTLDQGLRLECDLYMVIQTTKDRVEGVTSFLNKRPPEFKGEWGLMAAFEVIIFEKKNGVAWVTLNRPKQLNAYNVRMRDELYEILGVIRDDPEVLGAIFKGAGDKAFCAGADLTEFLSAPSPVIARQVRFERDVWGLFFSIRKPIVAAIHGYTLGSGIEIALCCDIRIASEEARFGLPETSLGFIPAAGGTQTLPRVVGRAAALEMLLVNEIIDARRALEVGLVNRVVPRADLLDVADTVCRKIMARNSAYTSRVKEAVSRGLDLSLPEGLALERTLALR